VRPRRGAPELARAASVRAVVLVAVWWSLAEGDLDSWTLAVVALPLALLASLALLPPSGLHARPAGLLRLAAFFVRQSLAGGADVARRAVDPALPLAPGFVEYRLRLPVGAPRIVFAATVSLLPGTLSARLGPRSLTIHLLDGRLPVEETLGELERRVGAAFGLPPAGEEA
jgi:multicomponent Na+:H+ antiporter subunit E